MRTIIAAISMVLTLSVLGLLTKAAELGTVNFSNGAAGVDAPVTHPNEIVNGREWSVDMLRLVTTNIQGVVRSNWVGGFGLSASFTTNPPAGYFFGGRTAIPNTLPGETATLKVRVWRYGTRVAEWEPITLTLGGGKIPPANLIGLQPMRVPPADLLSIAKIESGVALSWPSEFGGLQLQMSSELSGWQRAAEGRTTNGAAIIAPTGAEVSRRFFRLSN
jgi:hypothetical protein